MKKIIALILATIMVMFAVAACGGTQPAGTTAKPNTPDNGTSASTTEATTATTTTEQIVIPDPYTALAFLPTGSEVAVNAVTGEEIGKLTAADGIELKGGYFYVVDVVPAEGKQTATKEIGSAVTDKKVSAGWSNVKSSGSVLSKGSYWIKPTGATMRTWNFNNFMDVATLNTALEGTNLGSFGTITVKAIAGEASVFAFGTDAEAEELFSDYKWNFVYVGYKGTSYAKATGTTYTPLAMNAKELIYSAIDKAYEQEIGTLRGLWVTSMDTYGGLPSVLTDNGKWNGTSQQTANCNAFTNSLIPNLYDTYLGRYNTLLEAGETEASVAAALAAANAALDAANAALDAAIAANATVKPLKDAYVAAETALNTAKQTEYEAKAAYETEKAKSGADAETTKALKPAYDAATAAKNTAQATYDAAKAAFDGAVASDASLTTLNAAVTDATTAQKTANTNQTNVDNYKKYAALYEKFCAAYAEVSNVVLWDGENMTGSVLNTFFKDAENPYLPTFTYYYDAATDTYTVFVTSMTAKNFIVEWTSNDPIK